MENNIVHGPQQPLAPPPPAPPREDAAGEGGEAVATFSKYNAPLWAKRCCRSLEGEAASSTALEPKATTLTQKIPQNINDSMSPPKTMAPSNDDNPMIIDLCEESNDGVTILPVPSSQQQQQQGTGHKDALPKADDDWQRRADGKDDVDTNNVESHSSPACESGLLASVSSPEPSAECLSVARRLKGQLSPLQIEGAGLAIQRHCRLLANGGNAETPKMRAGFFLGDGAGIGKGRQIAAVLKDCLSRSVKSPKGHQRRRHLWLSVSRELVEDAKRDLTDVGCFVPVLDGAEELSGGKVSSESSGVLFITYALLTSQKGKRMEDIIDWLTQGQDGNTKEQREAAFDGCIIFDEAHKAKNLCGDPPTTTGLLVLALQQRLAKARVMYCSATGVSDLKQMAYAVRLGLWGPGTNFAKFDTFRWALEKRGVGAMELLALEMKQAGCFVARTLSWDGAEFATVQASLSASQIATYDRSMQWWEWLKQEIRVAVHKFDMGGARRMMWGNYWAALQRFCKELAICAKVPLVVEDAKKQLEKGHSVVIGLQSTGEASTQASLEELQAKLHASSPKNKTAQPKDDLEDVPLPGILSTAAAIMSGFVRNHFPVTPLPVEPIPVPTIPPNGFSCQDEQAMFLAAVRHATHINHLASIPPTPLPELVAKRQEILNAISAISLPPAPLDDLIDQLGGVDNVAEMTGRSGRILRKKGDGSFRFVKRVRASKTGGPKFALDMPISEEDTERLNLSEKKKFMDGRRQVAIISDAASTGISLHAAANSAAKHRRRVHYTIELPWAADKAIQQLGRTHRSGQASAPIYKMVVSNLGGERRFAAAVAKRMAGLGALTKGDRRAATGSDLSEFDIDSKFGRRALKRLYDCMVAEQPYAPSKGSKAILESYIQSGKLNQHDEEALKNLEDPLEQRLYVLKEVKYRLELIGIDADAMKKSEVKVFLNRIAAMTFAMQNLVFALFVSTMDDVINEAKSTGEFEGSVEDIRATSIELSSEAASISTDAASGAPTKLAIFNVDRGCSLQKVSTLCEEMIPTNHPADKEVEIHSPTVARSGFYTSKRQIMGRTLVLFAMRKIQVTETDKEDVANRIDYDPSGMMVLTRPNTGTNPFPMPTEEFRHKYRLVASLDDVRNALLETANGKDSVLSVMKEKYSNFTNMWEATFDASDRFADGEVGVAPRRSKLGIVTGAVLHCLPALEKSVAVRTLAERSLKIIRVETSKSGERFVGMKYPVDEGAQKNLAETMVAFEAARGGGTFADSFVDETPHPIQPKSVVWVTTAPKTMKSFFQTSTEGSAKRALKETPGNQREPKVQRMDTKKKPALKKSSITSFFKKVSP